MRKFILSVLGFSLVLFALFLVSPSVSLAQTAGSSARAEQGAGQVAKEGFISCGHESYQGGSGTKPSDTCAISDLFMTTARIINFMIAFAGLYTVFRLIMAGGAMVMANGNQKGVEDAKKSLNNAILGLIIVLLAFLIVNAIFVGPLGFGLKGGAEILRHPLQFITN